MIDGVITCLEEGCNRLRVPLIRRVGIPDGGMSIGLGSLSSYRVSLHVPLITTASHCLSQVHVTSHPTHAKSRLARVKAERQIKKEPSDQKVVLFSFYGGMQCSKTRI